MSFEQFLDAAWNDHATQAEQVAKRLPQGLELLTDAKQIPLLAQLVTHVCGEHLGDWSGGISLLKRLTSVPCFVSGSEGERAIERSIAVLELAGELRNGVEEFSNSDQIRILASAAGAVCERHSIDRAGAFLREALAIAASELAKDDPAHRTLAISGNNMACTLEERPHRSAAATELMILAAQTGRKFWEIAGTWSNVALAEYRLSQTYLVAGQEPLARPHAEACLRLAKEHSAENTASNSAAASAAQGTLEGFYGCEALALCAKARGDQAAFAKAVDEARRFLDRQSEEDRAWCQKSFDKLIV
jgi:hypothetical protein